MTDTETCFFLQILCNGCNPKDTWKLVLEKQQKESVGKN